LKTGFGWCSFPTRAVDNDRLPVLP